MVKLEGSLEQFAESINQGKAVSINNRGEWHVECLFVRVVKWIFGLRDQRTQKICSVFSKFLDELERSPILFETDELTLKNQKKKIQACIKVSEAVLEKLNKQRSKKGASYRAALKRKVVALKYRVESVNGGSDRLETQVDYNLYEELTALASAWKRKQKIFMGEDAALHVLDVEKIKEAVLYDEFTRLLLTDTSLQNDFFNWSIKNCNPVKEFIEFPSVCDRIKQCLMIGRIGRFAYANVLSSTKEKIDARDAFSATKKILSLPFEGRKISILDETVLVKFKGNKCSTISTIFEDMKMKNQSAGHFEFIGRDGIQNWNSHEMGWWNETEKKWEKIDLNKDRWWEDLPPEENITREEVVKRYHPEDFDDTKWLLIAASSRQSTSYNIDDCHGYTTILVPDGNGAWAVYDFGKYAKKWPKGFLGALGIVGNTVKADYVYPDANIFYSGFRQQAAVSFTASEKQGRDYFDRIKKNITDGRDEKLVFMFGWENCAYSPQTDLEAVLGKQSESGRIPNLFISHVLSADARKPLHYAFAGVKKAPQSIRKSLVWLCDLLLFSWRGVKIWGDSGKKIKKSLLRSPFRTGYELEVDGRLQTVYQHIFLPSHLHRQINEGKIDGVLWSGHHRMQVSSES